MLCWPSSITLFVALTLADSIAPKSYLCKLTMIVHIPLGHLLSITIPYWKSKLITRLVNFHLTSKSVQLTSYSLCETHLKVGLAGWCALLNYNLALNYAGLPRRFSSQNCKIESACLIGLAKWFHSWFSSEHDDVLLEIRNRNEESCGWSLVATTSLNLTIMSLPCGQALLDTSIIMIIPSPSFVT
jgi:hypothetical protein